MTTRRLASAAILLALCLSLCPTALGESADATPDPSGVRYAIDFSYMQTVIPGSVAWLYQPDTTIDQPVMLSDDPTYYLRKQFNGRSSSNGAIFVLGSEAPDFSAPVVTIYGANCMDCTMFGSLSNYQEDEYYQEHPTLYLVTPKETYQLDIFAGIRTKHTDTKSWLVSNTTAELWSSDLSRVLEGSFITPKDDLLPAEGDAWAILATDAYKNQALTRYVIYARKRTIEHTDAQPVYLNKMGMDSRETYTKSVSVDNVGDLIVYAQNDPIWNRLTFETQRSSKKRPYGDGGCGPTAVAMAIANLVDKEELPKLTGYASSPRGYQFCSCSINEFKCSGRHLPYPPTTPDEFARYFPIIIANFATGNNIWDVKGRTTGFGTSMHYVEDLCTVYGLSFEGLRGVNAAITALQTENTMVVASTSGYDSPFTKTSHFIVLAGTDGEYLYVLDPLQRESYGEDRNGYVEIVSSGLVRIKLENAYHCNIYPEFRIYRDSAAAQAE